MFKAVVVVLVAALIGCTKPNPNVCCATEAQCAELGVDDLRPCDVGQACAPDHACVAAECSVTADCTSPEAPICANGLCVGTCTSNDDCADVLGRPLCSPDGACVGCIDGSQCSASAPVCDAEQRACRGCERDDECASGVCIEADGVCAEEHQLVFVSSSINVVDEGTCSRQAPCATIGFAMTQVSVSRNVVRVVGGSLSEEAVAITRGVVLDGTATRISKPSTGPTFTISGVGLGIVMIEGFDLEGGSTGPTIRITGSGTARIARGTRLEGSVEVEAGALTIEDAELTDGIVRCSNGALDIQRVSARDWVVETTNCPLSVVRSRFDTNGDKIIRASGGLARVENNVFIQRWELADSLLIRSVAPTSTFRFNTVVNVSGIASDGVALDCDATLNVTSNVFAYWSMHPMGPGGVLCQARFSLFDDRAVSSHTTGEGNVLTPWSEVFVDLVGSDLHLRSAGLNVAEPSTGVAIDFEWMERGEMPDMGAFEAR